MHNGNYVNNCNVQGQYKNTTTKLTHTNCIYTYVCVYIANIQFRFTVRQVTIMESYRRSTILPFLLIVAVAVAVAGHPLPSSSALPVKSSVAVAAGEKVELSLYYEALCPYCENFILNYLYKIFDNGLIAIVDLKLSPYGNAKIDSNGTIVCQVCLLYFSLVFDLFLFVYVYLYIMMCDLNLN